MREFVVLSEIIQRSVDRISCVGNMSVEGLERFRDIMLEVLLVELGFPSSLTEHKEVLS